MCGRNWWIGVIVYLCLVLVTAAAASAQFGAGYGDLKRFYTEFQVPMGDVHVVDVAEDAQGRVVVATSVVDAAGARVELHRLMADGQLDTTFNAGMAYELAGVPTTPPSGALTFDGAGNILVGYTTLSPSPQLEDIALECITAAGVLCGSLTTDTGYGERRDAVKDVAVCGGDIVLVGDTVWNTTGDTDGLFVQVDATTFQLDPSFSDDGLLHVTGDLGGSQADQLNAVTCVADGRVAVGAAATSTGSLGWAVVVTDVGDLDGTFSGDGRAELAFEDSSSVRGVVGVDNEFNVFHHVLALGGAYYAAGATAATGGGDVDIALAKIGTNGSLDVGWGRLGWAVVDFGDGAAFQRDDVAYATIPGAAGTLHLVGRSLDPASRGAAQPIAAVSVPLAADGSVIEEFFPGGYFPVFVPLLFNFDLQSVAAASERGFLLAGHADDIGDQAVVVFDIIGEPPLFADGFDFGDTSAWSSASP